MQEIAAIPIHWYVWQMVYIHEVTDINESFRFLGIGEKVTPVLLRLDVALLKQLIKSKH